MNCKILLSALLIAALLVGCGREDGPAPSGRTVLVGVIAPDYGEASFKGRRGAFGMEQSLRRQGLLDDGARVVLRVQSVRDEADAGVAALEQLAQEPELMAVVSFLNSDAMLAVAPVAERLGVPVLLASATNHELIRGRAYVSQLIFDDRLQAEVSALYIRDELLFDRVAVFADPDNSYSRFLSAEFTRKFTDVGGTVLAMVEQGARGIDYATELESLRSQGPQLLYITLGANAVEAIVKELKAMAWQPQILVREGVLARLLARGPRPRSQFDGIIGTDVYMDDLPVSPAGRNYRSLEREVGESLDTYSVLGYESMLVLTAAMNRCAGQGLDRRCVAASVRNNRDLQGVVGPIAIDDSGHALRPVVVNTIQKGRLVYLVRVN